MNLNTKFGFPWAMLLLLISVNVAAADKLPSGVTATVNGTSVTDKMLDDLVKQNVSQGLKDTPELRAAAKDELISREVLLQEAVKQGIDKLPATVEQLAQIRQTFVINALMKEYIKKNPVTDAEIKAEYDRDVEELGDLNDLQQYDASHIVVATELEAKAIIATLKKGDSFDKIAKEKSIDQTRADGGHIGWVLPNQIMPAISNVLVNLNKGSVAQLPIRSSLGWHVVKLNDRRAYKFPALDEIKGQISEDLGKRKRMKYLATLRQAAKINQ